MKRPIITITYACLLLVCVLLMSRRAEAYPWMIRHQYQGCAQCHTDPSGAGLLTMYGRAQGELLLRTRYGSERNAQEAGKVGNFLFGAFELPEWLNLGVQYRGMYMVVHPPGGPTDTRFVQMQADAGAQVTAGRFRAYGTVGYEPSGASPAIVTSNLVSREHWVGVDLGEDKDFFLRAGRIMLPFGLRIIEHNMWVRQATRTDINAAQQHGVSLAYNGESVRGEIMGIAGNYQIRPDAFRERGYSGFVELSPMTGVGVGASSLVTYAKQDYLLLTSNTRQVHGVFARASPAQPLVIMMEADYLRESPSGMPSASGGTGMLSLDVEPTQGVHLMSAIEALQRGRPNEKLSLGTWLTAMWFFAPHADLRIDGIRQQVSAGGTLIGVTTVLVQAHVFL